MFTLRPRVHGLKQGILRKSDVISYVLANNKNGVFDSALRWHDNFSQHIREVMQANQIMTFMYKGDLRGLCTWIFTDDERIKKYNKIRWVIPGNITKGNILVVTCAVMNKGARVLAIKNKFEKMGYRKKINEVMWMRGPRGYRKEIYK